MKNKSFRVLSLFDGIAGARQALKELNVDCEYYASEIDKYAIQVAKANHPDIVHLGDVKDIDFTKFKDIDLMSAGFPCQTYSIAGNRKGLKDERGQLLYDVFRALRDCQPKYFLLENVKGLLSIDKGQTFKNILKELVNCGYDVSWKLINSALLTAQNRNRVYIVGKRKDVKGSLKIQQPEDKEIYLKDIIEQGYVDRGKSYCIDANYFKGGNLKSYFDKGRRQLVFNKPIKIGHFNKGGQGDRVYSEQGKSVCLSANGGGKGAKTGLYAIAQRGRNIVDGKRKDVKGAKTEQRFESSFSEKANTLTTVQKDSMLLDGCTIRKLTPTECCRLQGFPDEEKTLTFDLGYYILEYISIFINECQDYIDHPNKDALVEMKNHKLPKPVLNAQKDKLVKNAKYAQNTSNLKYQKTNKLALKNVHINLGELNLLKLNHKKLVSNVSNVNKIKKLALQNLTEVFAHLFVGQNTTQNKIIKIGKEDFLVSTKNFLTLLNGKDYVVEYGEEIKLLARCVMKNITPKFIKNFIAIISEALLSSKNYDQKLVIFLYYVLAVITLFTQEKIQIKSLLEVRMTNNYVSMVSNTQGYKALGNSFTVPVIKHILTRFIQL